MWGYCKTVVQQTVSHALPAVFVPGLRDNVGEESVIHRMMGRSVVGESLFTQCCNLGSVVWDSPLELQNVALLCEVCVAVYWDMCYINVMS